MGKIFKKLNKHGGMRYVCALAALLTAASVLLYAPPAARALPVEDLAYLISAGKGVKSVKAAEYKPGGLGTSKHPKTGLTVRGGQGYEASVNGVFQGDMRLEFAFVYSPIVGDGYGGGNFSFTVADADDPDDYFEVKYVSRLNTGNSVVAHVYYKGQIRGAAYTGSSYSGSVTTSAVWGDGSVSSPVSRVQAPFWGNVISSVPYISFEWKDDVLEVAVLGRDGNRRILARFDGTEGQSGIVTSSKYQLPKLNNFLENGYTVSFKSDYNGIDLASAIALASSDLISAAAGQGDAAAAAAALDAAVNDTAISASTNSTNVNSMKAAATKAKNAAAAVPVNDANLVAAAKEALTAAVSAYINTDHTAPLRDTYNAAQGGTANAAEVAAAAERTTREPGNDICLLRIRTESDSPNGFDNPGGIDLTDVRLFSAPWWYSEYLSRLPWFTVAFDSAGGTDIGAVSVRKGSKATQPAPPAKEGYVFGGWYKDDGFVAPWVFSSDTVDKDITLYAKWTEEEKEQEKEPAKEPEGRRGCKKDAAEAVSAMLVLAAAVFLKKKI